MMALGVVLDPIFLFGLHLGVAGAALATVVANACAVGYFTWHLARRSPVQSVRWSDVRLTKEFLGPIFGVGSSALVFTGIVPLLAYAYTSGLHDRLKAVVKTTLSAFTLVTVVLGTLMFVFRDPILGLFTTDPEVLRLGAELLAARLAADGFQAFGAAGPSHVLSAIRGVVLIPLLLVGQRWRGLEGVIWALPSAEVLGAAAGGLLWLVLGKGLLARPLEGQLEGVPVSG